MGSMSTAPAPHPATPSVVAPATDTEDAPPAWVRLIGPLMPLVPVVGVLASSWSQLGDGRAWQAVVLPNAVMWCIGVFMFMSSTPHLFMPAQVARSIGWAPSPFQWEVGVASLGMAIAGVMSGGRPREYFLALIIVFSTFMLGAAVGHVREMVRSRNFAAGNAGPIFVYDVLAPAFLIYLYAATA